MGGNLRKQLRRVSAEIHQNTGVGEAGETMREGEEVLVYLQIRERLGRLSCTYAAADYMRAFTSGAMTEVLATVARRRSSW